MTGLLKTNLVTTSTKDRSVVRGDEWLALSFQGEPFFVTRQGTGSAGA